MLGEFVCDDMFVSGGFCLWFYIYDIIILCFGCFLEDIVVGSFDGFDEFGEFEFVFIFDCGEC